MGTSQITNRGSDGVGTYDVFISYSTDPDYALVRNIEGFLRSFHRLKLLDGRALKELNVCVDGSSFLLGRGKKEPATVEQIVSSNLTRSKQLLVFCSKSAAVSKSVDFEIQWFLDRRSTGDVMLAITEGSDPSAQPDVYFSERLRRSQVTTSIWFDFRGFRSEAKSWYKVRDFNRERVRLAAELTGVAADQLYPEWLEQEQLAARRRLWRNLAVGIVISILLVLVFRYATNARLEQTRSEARQLAIAAETDAEQKPAAALAESVRAYDILATSGSLPSDTIVAAVRAQVLHAMALSLTSHPTLVTHLLEAGKGIEALASDGTVLWAGDSGGVAHRWNVSGQTAQSTFAGNVGVGNITAIASRGRTALITGTEGAELLIGDSPAMEQHRLKFDNAVAAALSPDGTHFSVGDSGGHVWIGDLAASTDPKPIGDDLKDSISAIFFPSATRLLVSAWNPGPIREYDLPSRTPAWDFRGIPWAAHALVSGPDDSGFASGHEHGEVAVWRLDRQNPIAVANAGDTVQTLASLNKSLLASGESDGRITLWRSERESIKAVQSFWAHRGPVLGLALLPQGLASGGSDGAVRFGNISAAGPLETVIAPRTDTGQDVAFTSSGDLVGVGVSKGTEWHVNGQVTAFGGWQLEVAGLSNDGARVVLAPPFKDSAGGLYVSSTDSVERMERLNGATGHTWKPEFSADGRWIAAARMGRSGRVAVWTLDSGGTWKSLWNLSIDAVESLAIDLNTDSLAIAGADRSLQVRDLKTGNIRTETDASRGFQRPNRLAYNPSGTQLALGYLDGTVTVVNAANPSKVIQVCEYHRGYISTIQFDPAGQWLASADSDGKLVLWDSLRFERIVEWANPGGFARAIRFSRDGKRLAITRQGGAGLSVFDVDPVSWRRRALTMAGIQVGVAR
jgi:WD40 repeat protein